MELLHWFRQLSQYFQSQGNVNKTIKTGPGRIPGHVAIIMDGNGRWAQKRGMLRTVGHREGMQTIRRVLKVCLAHGIKALTLYAFSTENWRRPAAEVDFLMSLPRLYLAQELPELKANGVKVCFFGNIEELPPVTRNVLENAVEETAENTRLTLSIAINYGSRSEIVNAVRDLAWQVKEGQILPADIDEEIIAARMYTAAIGDPDLLIRTGGEFRLSNFLLWQLAYTELWFTDVLWPDFGEKDFIAALRAYQGRERRYGRIPGQTG